MRLIGLNVNWAPVTSIGPQVLTTDEYWPAQADGPFPNIDKVRTALEAFASTRLSAAGEADGGSSTSDVGKKMEENTDNRPRP